MSDPKSDVGHSAGAVPFEFAGPWSAAEMTSFLDEATVPVRLACRTADDRLWMLSLWYLYRDGQLWCATERSADVVAFLDHDPEVAFEISVNEPPYKGIRGRGTATVEPDAEKSLLRDLVVRYLGDTDSDLAERLLADDREEVRIRIDPATVKSWDYSGRM